MSRRSSPVERKLADTVPAQPHVLEPRPQGKRRTMDPMWKYVAYAYLSFWAIIMVLGGAAAMVFDAPPAVMNGISILGSWSPTIVLVLMLKRLKPGTTIPEFFRRAFRDPLNIRLLFAASVIVFSIFLAAAWVSSAIDDTPLSARVSLPSALGLTILLTIFQGPTGEESGWRGYLRPELEDRYGFIKGNMVLGLVWAFWHAPLWFVASDYTGLDAIIYIGANIVVLTALTFIMATFMRRCENLLLAFWIHFCFNLSLRLFEGNVEFFSIISVLYVAVAIALLRLLPPKAPGPGSA